MNELIIKVAKRTMQMDLNVDKRGAWDWGAGVALYGLSRAFEYTRDQEIFDFIQYFVDISMEQTQIPKTVNTTAPLCSVLMLYRETGDTKYLDICTEFADWLMDAAPRTENGILEHSGVGLHWTAQAWIDTVFMAGVFLTRIGTVTGRTEYVEEGLKQVRLHIDAIQESSGLFYHGYDYKLKNHLSSVLWGRGNAWFTVSVPEIVEFSKIKDEDIIKGFQNQVRAVKECQDNNGLWHTVLTDKNSYCEVSASEGFVCGILKGMRMGLLGEEFKECAKKGAEAVIAKIADDGTVTDVSCGTGIQETVQMYYEIDRSEIMPWGQGLALLMLVELDVWKRGEQHIS